MGKGFKPANTVGIERIDKEMTKDIETKQPGPMLPGEFPFMKYLLCRGGQGYYHKDPEKNGVSDAPVSQQVLGLVQPEIGNKINIRDALGQRPGYHCLPPEYLTPGRFADAGAQDNMCERIQTELINRK